MLLESVDHGSLRFIINCGAPPHHSAFNNNNNRRLHPPVPTYPVRLHQWTLSSQCFHSRVNNTQRESTFNHLYCSGPLTSFMTSWSGRRWVIITFHPFVQVQNIHFYIFWSLIMVFSFYTPVAVTFSHQDPFKLYLPCSPACQTWFILVFPTVALFNNERQISQPPISHSFVSACVHWQIIGFNNENNVTQ